MSEPEGRPTRWWRKPGNRELDDRFVLAELLLDGAADAPVVGVALLAGALGVAAFLRRRNRRALGG